MEADLDLGRIEPRTIEPRHRPPASCCWTGSSENTTTPGRISTPDTCRAARGHPQASAARARIEAPSRPIVRMGARSNRTHERPVREACHPLTRAFQRAFSDPPTLLP